jgi:DNA ligase-1
MRRWSEVAERIAATTRTSEKTQLLAAYLATVDEDALAPAVVFFSGRAFPESDARSLGFGWATLADSVTRVAGVSRADLGAAYDRHSDLGRAVGDVLAARGDAAPGDAAARGDAAPGDAAARGDAAPGDVAPGDVVGPTVPEVSAAFAAIEAARGPAAKAAHFEALLRRCDPLTATYVVKILGGELRIGLREGLVEAAIARAFGRPAPDVARAAMLTGDLGETAVLARGDRLAGARLRLFHPLRFMLASPAEDAAEIVTRLGPEVWTEDKYDGIRVQLHRRGDEVRLFSRDLHDVSAQFPEVVNAARELPWDGILDGELLAFRHGEVLPFLSLQKRLGRKAPSASVLAEVPVAFVAFDLLAVGPRSRTTGSPLDAPEPAPVAPEPLLEQPLRVRRARLEGLGLAEADPERFALSRLATAATTDDLERIFTEARARRNEGLVVKDPASAYSPGRRGYGWLKMKKALATLDCVVVGVELGHGKRHGVLSDYTFAVRDEASGDLVTIGKAYSGLTDAEIAEMTHWFEAHTIARRGRYRVVEPAVVVEVAFDVIMRSARHASGFALRFPRIARIRDDKTGAEIDTLATVGRLWHELQHGAEHLVTQGATRDPSTP